MMADGDIHVYGTLRGRALAGLSGNKSAKVCTCMYFQAYAVCDMLQYAR